MIGRRVKFEIKVEKNNELEKGIFDSSDDAYKSAMECACTGIKSCLSEFEATVKRVSPGILVSFEGDQPPMTLSEFEQLVLGVFFNSEGKIYPEFKSISSRCVLQEL